MARYEVTVHAGVEQELIVEAPDEIGARIVAKEKVYEKLSPDFTVGDIYTQSVAEVTDAAA